MHITFLTSKINFERAGGSVPDLDCKVRSMQGLGADVRVITLYSSANKLPALPYPVVEEHAGRRWAAIQYTAFKALRKYEKNVDVYHVEGQFAYGAALYRLLGGKPVVVFYNRELISENSSPLHPRRIVEHILHRLLVPHIDHFIFTTPFLAQYYADRGLKLKKKQVSILVDFLDPTEMLQTVKRTILSNPPVRIFASGRMVAQKGFHLLLDALALLPESTRTSLAVTIGGDGPERESLLTRARELRVEVSFPGWIEKKEFWRTLSTTDIFVLPRWRIEQPSVVVMEALALNVPVVAPGNGGVEWMAGDAILPFTDNNTKELADRLRQLIESPEQRALLSQKAKERWEKLDHHLRARELWNIFQAMV